ncbi:hypothetical protein CEK64_02625 [Xanthomonas sontii]|uniref:hypothetical protein n=1 Tax=Xanthomonas sontii TaxID=2650745 RepID=UPI00123D06D8|nr:hypothetical protein [Xanthomonas sontii]KAA8921330.1 hypothetical protein CEK64_02625 [Xanthomonas sontii]
MPSTDIAEALQQHGYAVVRGFLGDGDIPDSLLRFLEGAEKFHDGVIGDLPAADMQRIQARIAATVPAVAAAMGLAIAVDRFGYCAIRIRESHAAPSLRLPFDQHRDPKTAPGGALNWHLDHFSYFLHGDHRNYLICYMPVRKPDADLANVAIVADDVVARLDPQLHQRIQGRGALRFRCVEADTLDWFRLRFPGESLAIGDWYAIEDLYDASPGWKIGFDLEAHKVVPHLAVGDLLIMRADVIHRTHDAGCDRISVRCDALPAQAPRLDTLRGLLGITLRYPFMSRKRRYNIRLWLRQQWRKRLGRTA